MITKGVGVEAKGWVGEVKGSGGQWHYLVWYLNGFRVDPCDYKFIIFINMYNIKSATWYKLWILVNNISMLIY